MKKIIGILMIMLMFACTDFVDKPKNLIPKDKMAELIAEMSLNEETPIINPSGNLEAGTRYILKKHKIDAQVFNESYKYYSINRKLEPILNDAQEIIKTKHPEATKYIDKKQKENQGLPNFAR